MASYHGPKARVQRRFGEVLIPRPKYQKILEKRSYPPGDHGKEKQFRSGRRSDYGLQLNEKQKLAFSYNVREKQLRRYFLKARKQPGNTGENLLALLEARLDNVVYRLGLADSRPQARQTVLHGHILVNGKKVDIPSYTVTAGDEISVKKKSAAEIDRFKELREGETRVMPSWLTMDNANLTGRVVTTPVREDIDLTIEEHLIVEYYSK